MAAFYKTQFALPGSNVEAQVLATALNVYATTLSLGGTIGQAYGFTVSADGLGADSFNVGAAGAAFGVAKKTTLNVYELLKAVDRQTVLGVLYNGDPTLQKKANHLLHLLNNAGSISRREGAPHSRRPTWKSRARLRSRTRSGWKTAN